MTTAYPKPTYTNKCRMEVVRDAMTREDRRAIVLAGQVEAVAKYAALPIEDRAALTSVMCLW